MTLQTKNTRNEMNAMYRLTRHIYDASRKYYLLGRDRLITRLKAQDNENICEVGCGTARNLIKMKKAYPTANFFGLDASDEMLKTANNNLKNNDLFESINLKQAYAQNFNPKDLFAIDHLNKIVFSYALSIIPPWKDSIDHALKILPKGGEVHIVDFGNMEALPKPIRATIFWWLRLFHVYHKPEILEYLKTLRDEGKGTLKINRIFKGYAYLAKFVLT